MKTAKFKEYRFYRSTGIRGGSKLITETVEVEDILNEVTVSFMGITKKLFTRGKDKDSRFKKLYNEDGSYAIGRWKHGRYGSKIHSEPIEIDANNNIVTVTSYASGQIKDQHKYLLAI